MKPCNQCGKCCINYSDGGLSATPEELEMWELFRPDIYSYVKKGEIWFDPKTDQQLTRCPWLQQANDGKYICDIYHDRPEDCRHYPVTIEQMLKDECEMLEVQDLNNLNRAQKDVDRIMSDSRPAVLP